MTVLVDMPRKATEAKINLRKLYPISHRWPLLRSIHTLAIFVFSTILISVIDYHFVSVMENELTRNTLHLGFVLVFVVTLLAWLGRWLIFEIELWHYDYKVDHGHFFLSKGIFLKHKGSFPLSRITDIYTDRSVLDFVFGLWNVHVSTPTSSSGEFAHICGLTEKNAVALQRRLSELVQTYTHEQQEVIPRPQTQLSLSVRNVESYKNARDSLHEVKAADHVHNKLMESVEKGHRDAVVDNTVVSHDSDDSSGGKSH